MATDKDYIEDATWRIRNRVMRALEDEVCDIVDFEYIPGKTPEELSLEILNRLRDFLEGEALGLRYDATHLTPTTKED